MDDPGSPPRARRLADLLPVRLAAFGLLYFAFCRLGDEITSAQSDLSTLWPASGFLLAVLLLAPVAEWPWFGAAVIASELLAGAAFHRRASLALAFAAADLAEAAVAAWLVRRIAGARAFARRPSRDLMLLIALGAVVGPALGAAIGTAAAQALHPRPDPVAAWLEWLSGDALGVLVVTPALLAWAPGVAPRRPWTRRRAGEVVLLALASVGAALVLFGGTPRVRVEYGYLLLPLLGWAAFRFGLRGTALLGAALTFLAATASARAGGLAGRPDALAGLHLEVQALMAVSVTAALLLAAINEERDEASAGLRESEARFAAFLEESPAALFLKDAAGRLVVAGRALADLHHLPAGRLAGVGAAELLLPEVAAQVAAEERRVLETGAPVRSDVHVAGRTFLAVKFRVPREGRAPLLGGVGVDVTEQRSVERALRLAQVALDRTYSAVLIVGREGRVAYANQAAARLLARPPEALAGLPLWELDAAFDQAGWEGRWQELRAQGTLVGEGWLLRPGGERLEGESSLALVTVEGVEHGVYAARDLSDRRRAESAQRLASVGTLAAGMAHEINNPLTFVAANLAFALDALGALRGQGRVDEALRALEDAEEGTRRVAGVVRDLRAVSRTAPEDRHPVDLWAEIEMAIKLAHHELRHRARLVRRLDPVPAVEAVEFQLGQVVVNLLVNAAHAIPEGAADRNEVRVSSRTAADGAAIVEVSDTGAGIPPEVRARIFEPFFTTKPVGRGTGLGLSVCHGIVTGLGGRIEVESEVGVGSTFRLVLPAAGPAAAPEQRARTPAPPAARARILVVDDEPLIGSTIRRVLAAHEVIPVTAAREALARIRGGERFDLILCDLMMPELTGMDLHAILAAERPALARRMVFVTGGAFTDRAREFLERSGAPQITKPFAPQDLRDGVRAWLAEGADPLAGPAGSG